MELISVPGEEVAEAGIVIIRIGVGGVVERLDLDSFVKEKNLKLRIFTQMTHVPQNVGLVPKILCYITMKSTYNMKNFQKVNVNANNDALSYV